MKRPTCLLATGYLLLIAGCAPPTPLTASAPPGSIPMLTSNSASVTAAQSPTVASPPLTERSYSDGLQRWISRDVRELIAEWGPPRVVFEADQREPNKRYLWIRNEGEVEYQGERLPASCATRFVVDASGAIRGFFYDGNSCKAPDRSPYAGIPTFLISGTGRVEDPTTLQTFSVVEFIGVEALPSQAGCGSISIGAGVPARCIGSEVPARPMKVRLRGAHRTDTVDQEVARRANGTLCSVEGVVEFIPVAGHQYVVTGTLAPGRSAVWVEDTMTKQPATAVVRE